MSSVSDAIKAPHVEQNPKAESQDSWCTCLSKTALTIAGIATIVLGVGLGLYLGYSGYVLSTELHSTTIWVFNAQKFTAAILSTLAGAIAGTQMIWARIYAL